MYLSSITLCTDELVNWFLSHTLINDQDVAQEPVGTMSKEVVSGEGISTIQSYKSCVVNSCRG